MCACVSECVYAFICACGCVHIVCIVYVCCVCIVYVYCVCIVRVSALMQSLVVDWAQNIN